MPPKKKTPVPIDRPLSRAYLRGFTGWSTAYPPGQSEPTSLRLMENMLVDRNGALGVRPGLRYLSYTTSPDINPDVDDDPGIAIDRPLVGTQEPFYVMDGNESRKALLFAVREANDTVGFRAILFAGSETVVRQLTDDSIGFSIPQGTAVLNFSPATTHVEYLQIDNKIVAMSDAGEDIRMFYVGAEKLAKRLGNITQPQWEDTHKLRVVHPADTWISQQGVNSRRNEIYNPSFESGGEFWTPGPTTLWATVSTSPHSGTSRLELKSAPARTNMATSPLHNMATYKTAGWYSDSAYASPKLTVDGTYMKVTDASGKGHFLAYGAKMTSGVKAGYKYKVALDFAKGSHVNPRITVMFYNAAGAMLTHSGYYITQASGRYVSPVITAPAGAVGMRLRVGGYNTATTSTYVKYRNVVVCRDTESTNMFNGSSPSDATHKYFWTGTANASASVDHPPSSVSITCNRVPVKAGLPFWASIYTTSTLAKAWTIKARAYDKDAKLVIEYPVTGSTTAGGGWVRAVAGSAGASPNTVTADLNLTFTSVARGEIVYVDSAMLESGVGSAGIYFDGSTAATTTTTNQWADRTKPHRTWSLQTIKAVAPASIPAETPTTKTLIATGGAAANPYKMGFFYTFENEVGESAASKIVEIRMSRPWSNWVWETPNAAGEPSGIATDVAELCADQLVCTIPQAVYDQAVAEGALKWNLYAFAWSDQEAVPIVAQIVAEKDLYPDESATMRAPTLTYLDGGWMAVTPARRLGINEAILPTRTTRVNSSRPPKSRTGLVAGDRLIMLGDPEALATIRWSSSRAGEYTNFSAARGGGAKTLTSGNLNVPASVVLWQNPQSVDTLTVLCMSLDGMSVTYYMMPADINAQQATTGVMGFEETTSTPGTVTPYGAEVMNNALFRPIDKALLKSTASNYNISHKTLSDNIENMWRALRDKQWIMSAQLNNRLAYLVNNPYGATLEDGCKGNEIWIHDAGSETGVWSRFLIQASSLRVLTVSGKDYMGVTRPEGLFYLDPDARADDWVVTDQLDPDYLKVLQRPIPWRFETNTQGANRAHDAWAHLQMIQVTLGNFRGTMRYGIRGHDLNHRDVDASKQFSDDHLVTEDGLTWDVDDILQIRRDMKEWFFYASSVDGVQSSGQVGFVQYRYTPVSVNVGYEFGSVETFEYGGNVESGPNGHSENGIPVPVMDFSRP